MSYTISYITGEYWFICLLFFVDFTTHQHSTDHIAAMIHLKVWSMWTVTVVYKNVLAWTCITAPISWVFLREMWISLLSRVKHRLYNQRVVTSRGAILRRGTTSEYGRIVALIGWTPVFRNGQETDGQRHDSNLPLPPPRRSTLFTWTGYALELWDRRLIPKLRRKKGLINVL